MHIDTKKNPKLIEYLKNIENEYKIVPEYIHLIRERAMEFRNEMMSKQ